MTDIQSLVDQAWAAAFVQNTPNGVNPNWVPGILDNPANVKLADVSNVPDTSGQINLCTVPFDPNPPVAKGNAAVTCTGMTMAGLVKATGGTPVFAPDLSTVALPIGVNPLQINGSFRIDQTCCISTGWDCIDDTDSNLAGTFQMTIQSVVMTLNCRIVANSALTLSTVGVTFGAASATSSVSKSLDWIDAFLHVLSSLSARLEGLVLTLLSSDQLKQQMQQALDGVLGVGPRPSAAV